MGLMIILRRHIIFGTRKRRGEIYLDDSDTLYIVKERFYLQPAPPRYKIPISCKLSQN